MGRVTWSSIFFEWDITRNLWFYSFTEHETRCCVDIWPADSTQLKPFQPIVVLFFHLQNDVAKHCWPYLLCQIRTSSACWPSCTQQRVESSAVLDLCYKADASVASGCILKDLLHDLELRLLLTLILTLELTPLMTLLHTFSWQRRRFVFLCSNLHTRLNLLTRLWEEVRLMLFSESWKPLNWQMYSKYVFIRLWFCSEGCYTERVPSNRNLACLKQLGPGVVWKSWVLPLYFRPEGKLPVLRVTDQEKCLLLDHQALSQRRATAQALLFTFQKIQSDKSLIHRTMHLMYEKPTGT